jgi:hypothetical protein
VICSEKAEHKNQALKGLQDSHIPDCVMLQHIAATAIVHLLGL